MKLDWSGAELFVPAGGLLRLEEACGKRIACTDGLLWITVAGEYDDIFLHAGQCYDIPAQGLVLVESLENSRVAVGVQARKMVGSCAGLPGLMQLREMHGG